MKKCIIRPFNAVNILFLLITLVFLVFPIYIIADYLSNPEGLTDILIIVFCLPICGWISVLLLNFFFRPKIVLYDTYMEIHHWENGTPYDKNHPLRIPKITKTVIKYSELSLFGAFLIKEIMEYVKKNSGFLADIWTDEGKQIPAKAVFPDFTARLRDVLLFAKSDGDSLVIDGGQYGFKQVQFLLYELELRAKIKSSGKVQPKKHVNSLLLNMLTGLGVICWLTILSISTIWLEGFFNAEHTPAFQSAFRIIYIISVLFANLCLTGYLASRIIKNNTESKSVGKVFGIIALILYPIFIITFVLSVLS